MGYVEQQDNHVGQHTVREALEFSAELRLPSSVTPEARARFVDQILEDLELAPLANRVVGDSSLEGLAPGELKRVTIGQGISWQRAAGCERRVWTAGCGAAAATFFSTHHSLLATSLFAVTVRRSGARRQPNFPLPRCVKNTKTTHNKDKQPVAPAPALLTWCLCVSSLCADEPTSGLDSRAALIVLRVIRKIASRGRSVVCTIRTLPHIRARSVGPHRSGRSRGCGVVLHKKRAAADRCFCFFISFSFSSYRSARLHRIAQPSALRE